MAFAVLRYMQAASFPDLVPCTIIAFGSSGERDPEEVRRQRLPHPRQAVRHVAADRRPSASARSPTDAADASRRAALHIERNCPGRGHRHGRRTDGPVRAWRPDCRGAIKSSGHRRDGPVWPRWAAGAIAMGLGGYLAAKSDAEHYLAEQRREEREVREIPRERDERGWPTSSASTGVAEEHITPVVEAMTRRPKEWVDFMMRFRARPREARPEARPRRAPW